jgi:hypothetical protein
VMFFLSFSECVLSVAGQGPNNGVVFPLGSVLRTCCHGNVFKYPLPRKRV